LVQKLTAVFEQLGKENLDGILFEINAKGANLKEFPLCLKDWQNAEDAIETWHKYIRALRECPVPVTALIRDQARGGGYESALACDKIVAEENARIGLPEVGLGILPGGGGTQNLTRRVGLAKGAEMILGAKVIKARKPFVDEIVYASDPRYVSESHDMFHLVQLCVRDKLKRGAHTVGIVEQIKYFFALAKVRVGWMLKGIYPPVSIWFAESALRNGYQTDIEDGMWYEMDAILRAFETEDAREGISASPVFERRKPRFSGK
jgi:enoyl-CoA hydratase/carnithine racemase